MGGNTTCGTVPVTMAAQWKAYDSLPAAIREVYARAPYDYAMPRVARKIRQALRGGHSVAELRRAKIRIIADDLMRTARRTYGPDHPDAQFSRLEGRP